MFRRSQPSFSISCNFCSISEPLFERCRTTLHSGSPHRTLFAGTSDTVGDQIPDGIGEYTCPDARSAAMVGFSEAIQWLVSFPRGREAARADFTP
jgi:hypothetical protein